MKEEWKGKSGKRFFLTTLGLIVGGILATVMLANSHRNLDLLLASLGYPDLLIKPGPAAPVRVRIKRSKGVRLPSARVRLPVYTFADFKTPEQHFIRLIQSNPRTLCDDLKAGGFGDLAWTVSGANKDKWECMSFRGVAGSANTEKPSSLFISINGDGENRVTSFRVKLNIEDPADAVKVVGLAGNAANIFLRQVRWGTPDAIIDNIHQLKAFDISNFGSRIQFKKEFGEIPRFNFIASEIAKSDGPPGQVFFDHKEWFPLTDSEGLPMIDGMMAGESPTGLPLSDQAKH